MNRLSDIFSGWSGYQLSLAHAIAPLDSGQLTWKPSPAVRSIGELARHIAMGRINWFVRMNAPRSAELAARVEPWFQDAEGNRHIAEKKMAIDANAGDLVKWL